MADPIDEDREIRDGLSVLPLDARVQLAGVLEWPPARLEREIAMTTFEEHERQVPASGGGEGRLRG
jgi:hypothetical protein